MEQCKKKMGMTLSAFYKPVLILTAVLSVCIILLKDYFVLSFPTILILLTLPFVFSIEKPGAFSLRYFFVSVLFLLGFIYLGGNMFLYWALVCMVLFTVEWFYGKINFLIFILFMLLSPALYCLVRIFTFPIRLCLSNWASDILTFMGCKVINKGSYFVLADGFSFSVDQACVGLNMIITGLCIALVLVLLVSKQKGLQLPLVWVACTLLLAFGFILLTNLLRIVALVFFKSMPGTFSHEAIGVLAFVLFTIIPLYVLVIKLFGWFGKQKEPVVAQGIADFSIIKTTTVLFVYTLMLIIGLRYSHQNDLVVKDKKVSALSLEGFTKKINSFGVTEFTKENLLVYIKPGVRGWEGDHPPQICWQASGFELVDFSIKKMGKHEVMWGTLKRDNRKQYTAWWYDNGTLKTISQLEWRLAGGEPFRIINITCPSKEQLFKYCNWFLQKRLF